MRRKLANYEQTRWECAAEKTKRKQKKTMMRKLGPMTTRTFVKNIPQDTLVNLHWNTRVMSRRAPVQQMRVWKTTIPFSYFRTMILTALKIFFYVRRRTYLFTRSIEPRSIARHWRFRQENIHWMSWGLTKDSLLTLRLSNTETSLSMEGWSCINGAEPQMHQKE